MKRYAGIGSRETPLKVLNRMDALATYLEDMGWTLRSGGAKGADTAFESGLFDVKNKEIFTANSDIPEEAFQMAEQFHPAWHACKDYARKLHARNGMIIFGQDMKTPVNMIVCWTKDGKATGGTGQALRIADYYEIPVFNYFFPDCERKIANFVGAMK